MKTKNQELRELSQVKDPELRATLKKILDRAIDKDLGAQAKEAAREIREEIAPGGKQPPEQMWIPCAPMPTDMCRVSPFFPMARQKLDEWLYVRDLVITDSSWGKIKYTGPKLSTYDEDVLMAVLAILDQINRRRTTEVGGRTTYTYRGPLLPILRLMGYNKFGTTNYKRVLASLERMTGAVVKLEIYQRTTRGKRKVARWQIVNILSGSDWDERKKILTVTVNPFFYEQYAAGTVTLLDMAWRVKLKSPIAKSLQRFMQSHRDDRWNGHFLTLAAALNLDLELPAYELRRRIKVAIRELIKHKFLMPESGFLADSKDVVHLLRCSEAKTRRKTAKALPATH